MKKILCLVLASLMSMILFVPMVSAQTRGPLIDVLRFKVGDMFSGMLSGSVDVAPSFSVAMDLCPVPEAEADKLLTATQIESLATLGNTVTQDSAYHVGFIGYNIRNITATGFWPYYRPFEIFYWPLADVEFRHALIHSFDQLGILPRIYGYTVTPVRSLVPPAQSKYYNPDVEPHPYNPGNPFTSPPGENSTCGILKAAGYTFEDQGKLGVVDAPDFWRCPNYYLSPVPRLKIMVPHASSQEEEFGPRQVAEEFVADLASVGLASTSANGYHGFEVQLVNFETYLATIFGRYPGSGEDAARFDAFMGFFDFGSLPSQLYSFCHSSQDVLPHPGRRNAVGMNDTTIDSLVETVKYSLDPNDIEYAAKEVQEMLYDPELPGADGFALAYMCLYSKIHFNVYDPNLGGIVKSQGYGSDNKWTFLNIHWITTPRVEGGKTVVIWALPYDPSTLNPLDASTLNPLDALDSYGSEIREQVYDGLTNIDPYNHYDIPWIATDWSIWETTGGMEIYYTIRDDVTWQDGKPLTASDIEWCLEFIRDRHVPKYAEAWEALTDVVVTSPTTFTIFCNKAGISLFYDFNGLAALLPRHIWDRPWIDDVAVLTYDPTEAYNVAPGYTPGPTPPPTNLFGTGPFVFQFYDFVNQYSDLWRNINYFMSQADVQTLKIQMFWEAGDYTKTGVIDVYDLNAVSSAFGYVIGNPGYDPDADFNSDGIIDMRDMRACAFHLSWQKEYP